MDTLVFDFCGLVICVVLLCSTALRKQYRNRANKILFWFVVITAIATFSDLMNAVVVDYFEVSLTNRRILYFLNFMYFLSHNMILPLYVVYIYASADIWHKFVKSKFLIGQWLICLGVGYIPLFLNGLLFDMFSISEDMKYVRGPHLIIGYLNSAVMAVWGIIVLIKYRKIINKDKIVCLFLTLPLVGLGIAIQYVNAHILIEMFLISVSMLMFMVIVQREENLLDPVSGALKYDAGIARIKKSFLTGKQYTILFVKITNHHNLKLYLGQGNYNELLRKCAAAFTQIAQSIGKETDIFYLQSGLFAYVIESNEQSLAHKISEETMDFLGKEIEVSDLSALIESKMCLVSCPEDIDDYQVLLTVASTFHKTAKATEKMFVYSELKDDRDFRIRNDITEIIRRGLKNNSFKMYYQPIYSTTEHRFVSAEALIRLEDEEYGMISPGIFIPMAELNGQIHEIGDFVLENVVRFISENNIQLLGLNYIEMNLSASQCIEVDLVDKIKNTLEKYKVSPGQLSLELTENAADINPVIVDQNIERLHDYGIRIALDDYGTGYSNIKRVTSLPIDQVKLDKSFVDLVDDTQMWIVIQDTIKMLKEMGKEVLVEGVEKEEVAKRFMELDMDLFLGCELIQGFYFCKPLSEEKFIEFISNHVEHRARIK